MLTEKQTETLAAAVNRVIPPDDFPGGWDAGVGDYLQRQFTRDLLEILPLYEIGLDALDGEARVTAGTGFAEMTPEAQDALLTRVEAGQVVTAWPLAPSFFFDLLVRHAMEGYYADPGNGGNKDDVAWEMVGFEVTG